MKKVSIIIPVYNVENYIEECLNSIKNQSYKNIEIILIDDGSTDQSGYICEKFKKEDNRIIVFHQSNSGVSTARNKGLELAKGDYIMFVDPDDYLNRDFIKIMINNFVNSEIVICGYYEKYVNSENIHKITDDIKVINQKEAINLLFDRKYYNGYLWNKIFLKKIIKDNGIQFNKNIHMCEDLLFVTQYMIKCTNVTLLPNSLYYYRIRNSSMVFNKNSNKFISLFDAYKEILILLKKYDINSINFRYTLVWDIYVHRKKISIQEQNNKFKFNFTKEYLNLIYNRNLAIKRKLKLFIIKNFNFLYILFLSTKYQKFIKYK